MAAPGEPDAGVETLVGRVTRVVFQDASSRYTVLRLRVDGEATLQTAVGRVGQVDEGAAVCLWGRWTEHPTHGRQFQWDRFEAETPKSPAGVMRRLRRYPQIGAAMAERIWAHFGQEALAILDRDPERLQEVPGIGRRSVEKIVAFHGEHQGPVARLEAHLVELGLPPHLGALLHGRYGAEAEEIVRGDPYRLARDVRGIGFMTADRVARAHGVAPDSPSRVEAGLLHVLERAEGEGHCALPVATLLEQAVGLLDVAVDEAHGALGRLCETAHLEIVEGVAGEPLAFRHAAVVAEERVAGALARLAHSPAERWEVGALPKHLGRGQMQAVRAVAEHRAVILTGGPGTGKSTVVRNVLELARRNRVEVLLCAPTGRAAKRLEQATGQQAFTVHRLLGVQPEGGGFAHGVDNPLPPALVVVDEASMLDLWLARALLDALDEGHRLLLVGDADQLPSVGPGNVLRDVLQAAKVAPEVLPVVRLQEVFRQADGSPIVVNAHRILAGQSPAGAVPESVRPGDAGYFMSFARSNPQQVRRDVLRMVTEQLPRVFGLDPRTDVQVLTPMHRGVVGTESFNQALQEEFTAGQPSLEVAGPGKRRFRVGDRVMQTRNDYERNVFNGDVGVVTRIDRSARALEVDMEGQRVRYEAGHLGALRLAYAMSIHKSQGSEFPAVIVVLMPEHHVMLRRNLLYTAVTRARRVCVLLGDRRAVERAVRRSDAARRHTGLEARLRDRLGGGRHWVPDRGP